MKKMNKREQFGWSCGYERIYGSYHADNERCVCSSKEMFDTILEAAREGLKHKHKDSTYVFSTKKGYIGLADGLYFNNITT